MRRDNHIIRLRRSAAAARRLLQRRIAPAVPDRQLKPEHRYLENPAVGVAVDHDIFRRRLRLRLRGLIVRVKIVRGRRSHGRGRGVGSLRLRNLPPERQYKSFGRAFSKARGVEGQSPRRTPQSAEFPGEGAPRG